MKEKWNAWWSGWALAVGILVIIHAWDSGNVVPAWISVSLGIVNLAFSAWYFWRLRIPRPIPVESTITIDGATYPVQDFHMDVCVKPCPDFASASTVVTLGDRRVVTITVRRKATA